MPTPSPTPIPTADSASRPDVLAAVVADDLSLLWARFGDGSWSLADLAPLIEEGRGPADPALFRRMVVGAGRRRVAWPDGPSLPAGALLGTRADRDVIVRAHASDSRGWLRPLLQKPSFQARWERTPGPEPAARLAEALAMTPAGLARLLGAYPVALDDVSRRVLDLADWLAGQGRAEQGFYELTLSWPLWLRTGNERLITPLEAIRNGRLALVEHVLASGSFPSALEQ